MNPTPPPAPAVRTMDAAEWDDWITIWHSELAAAVTDREAQEVLLHLLDLWAAAARRAAPSLEPHPGPHAPPRAAPPAAPPVRPPEPPADASPDARGDAPRDPLVAELLARVADLERQLRAATPP